MSWRIAKGPCCNCRNGACSMCFTASLTAGPAMVCQVRFPTHSGEHQPIKISLLAGQLAFNGNPACQSCILIPQDIFTCSLERCRFHSSTGKVWKVVVAERQSVKQDASIAFRVPARLLHSGGIIRDVALTTKDGSGYSMNRDIALQVLTFSEM